MKNSNSILFAARHKARFALVQALYQWHLAQENISEIEIQFLTHTATKKIDKLYFSELLRNIPLHLEELQTQFTSFLDRPLKDLDPVELTILYIGTYELLYRKDIPYKVIINEALELTKTFGSVEGFKFVNGILDKVAKTLRKKEIK